MDIIKSKNNGYGEYEELLLKRDKLRKEAYILQGRYMAQFGDLITAVFEKKVACIRLKKTIAYCQAAINRGKTVDVDEMQDYIEEQMTEYHSQLDQMIAENEAAHNMGKVSEEELTEIKAIYRKLAKVLHPDINPETEKREGLKDIWNMITSCYNANDLEGLKEMEDLTAAIMRNNPGSSAEIKIDNLHEKIQKIRDDIDKIISTDPYQYKFFLADAEKVRKKTRELEFELSEFEDYEEHLKQVLDQLYKNGGSFIWRMN